MRAISARFGLLAAAAALALAACAGPNDWPNYRYVLFRNANQPTATALSDPTKVPTLAVRWTFPATGTAGTFKASPIVVNGTVFIGSMAGYFYAIDAATGALKWQYPAAASPGLVPSTTAFSYGIASSAAYWYRSPDRDVVIFAAQDPSLGAYGSARLFARYADDGSAFWTSDPVATINGATSGSTTELHQTVRYSSPLIYANNVYIGIADSGDNPIQNGQVVAVDINTGHINTAFSYTSTGTRGGGVWNAPAADLSGVFFTTGNTHCWNGGCQSEPTPNHGLSMIRVDRDSGVIMWAFQPVPFSMDDDPDWSAGAAVAPASCGERIVSVQKDGWAYALDPGGTTPSAPVVYWQFPPTGYPFSGPDMGVHGDFHYKMPAAIWNDVAIMVAGGELRMADGPTSGYGRLHALNICAGSEATRVRWLLDVPHATLGNGYTVGAPTVTGGIVYVGTNQGHVVAIADPNIAPGTGTRCSDVDYTTAAACTAAGYVLVPIPAVLADVAVPDGSSLVGLRNEPALAGGRVFVGSTGGHVYMLSP